VRDSVTGEPTGLLFEMGGWLGERMPKPDSQTLNRYTESASSSLVAAGVTSVTDAGRDNIAIRLELYAELVASCRFLPRPTVMLSPGAGYPDSDRPRGVRTGATKLAITFSGGEMYPDFDALVGMMRSAHDSGRQIAVHAVEIEAVAMACEAFAALGPRSEVARMRHRIEHASECPPEVARSIAAAGASVVTQPGFISDRGDRYLRAWRAGGPTPEHLYAVKTMLEAGLRVAGSSDAPVGPVAPLAGVQAAVLRASLGGEAVGAEQSISIRQALRLYGTDAAWMGFQEGELGSIGIGKLADLVVLAADPTAVEASEIASIPVLATLIGGELVHGSLPGLY
ncbi:MAG: amidohydrolase family protein, partial [Chloroflexi bacterium]|nr:amidohydrolase family protein [Chloroflexota bacterium]